MGLREWGFVFFFGGGDGGGRIYENDMMYVIIYVFIIYVYISFFSLKHGLSQRRFEKCFVC